MQEVFWKNHRNCSWMMIKSFLIIRFLPGQGSFTSFLKAMRIRNTLSLTYQFSAKLHNACGHDIKRHVTAIYEWTLRAKQATHTGNKITNYLRPYLCSVVEQHHKNSCASSVSLFMTVYFYVFFSLQKFSDIFMGKFLFNFICSQYFGFCLRRSRTHRTWLEIRYFYERCTIF